MPLAHFEGSIFPKEPNLYYNVSSVDVEDAKDFTSSAKDDEIDVDEEEKVHSQSLLRSSSRPTSNFISRASTTLVVDESEVNVAVFCANANKDGGTDVRILASPRTGNQIAEHNADQISTVSVTDHVIKRSPKKSDFAQNNDLSNPGWDNPNVGSENQSSSKTVSEEGNKNIISQASDELAQVLHSPNKGDRDSAVNATLADEPVDNTEFFDELNAIDLEWFKDDIDFQPHVIQTQQSVNSQCLTPSDVDSLASLDYDTMELIAQDESKSLDVDLSSHFKRSPEVLRLYLSEGEVSQPWIYLRMKFFCRRRCRIGLAQKA